MSNLSKQDLKAENQLEFPNNNTGQIQPSNLRKFNVDMIDSTVNQIQYTSDSGSWTSNIATLVNDVNSIELITGSLLTSASNALVTASFDNNSRDLTFTKGNNSTFTLNIPAANINTGSFVTTSSFDAFSQSVDSRLDNIESATGSYVKNVQTASMTVLSASFATTAAFALNSTTINTGSLVTTSSFNAYTSSTNSRLNAIESVSGSWITESETASFARVDASNTFTQNNSFLQNVTISGNLYVSGSEVIVSSSTLIVGDRIIEVNGNRVIGDAGIYAFDAIGNQTGSLIWNPNVDYWLAGLSGSETRVITAADTASMLSPYVTAAITGSSLTTASFSNSTRNITFTKGDSSTFNIGGFATTGSNSFVGAQFITGALSVSGSTQIKLQTNGIIGDPFFYKPIITIGAGGSNANMEFSALDFLFYTSGDFKLFSDLLRIEGPDPELMLVDTTAPTAHVYRLSNSGSQLNILAEGGGVFPLMSLTTSSIQLIASSTNASGTFTASLAQGFTYVGDASGRTIAVATSSFASVINTGSFVTTSSFNSYTSSTNSRLNNLEAATSSYITSAMTGSMQVATASVARNVVIIARNGNPSTLAAGTVVHITGASGDNPIFNTASYDVEALSANTLGLLRNSSPSGADVEVVVNGIVTGVNTDPVNGFAAGDIVYLGATGSFTKTKPQAPLQVVALGQVLRAQQNNGSLYVSINNGWELDELHDVRITNAQTGDLIQYDSASALWTNKSLINAGVTSTSSFNAYTASTNSRLGNIELTTASLNNSVSLINSATASLFTSASLALVTASVAGNVLTFRKGDNSTFNLTVDTGSGGGGGAAFPFTGSAAITGSLIVTGSMRGNVVALTVASSTASVDFTAGNVFTLTLPSASTHINPTNIRAGQTINIQITQPTPGTGSVTFPPAVKFAGGNDYQATATGSAVDILTFVAFDTTSVLATSIKNLL